MRNIYKQFKTNDKPKLSDSIEILFDFVVVALVSLIFNGFIINSHSSVFDQKYLMVTNAMLLSTHWYAYNFFRQRYEKKNIFFRVWTLFNVLSLAIMATGIDLLVFRENSHLNNIESYHFLRWMAPAILIFGIILSRLSMAMQFLFAYKANKNIHSINQLTKYKFLSRFLVVFLALAHILLIVLLKNNDQVIKYTTFTFFPAYLVIEFIGNITKVNNENIKESPTISINYMKERYMKLDLLYIASFFISGTIQFAFYFKTSDDLYMLPRLLFVYLIGFMIWWVYMDRIRRYEIDQTPRNLKILAIINIMVSGSLVLFGGMLINASDDKNLYIIIPSVFLSAAMYLLCVTLTSKTFKNGNTQYCMNRNVKFKMAWQALPIILVFTVSGIVFIFIDCPSLWIMNGIIISSLMLLNIGSRHIIKKYVKNVETI